MAFKIESVTAFVSVDSADGDEGIIGIPMGEQGIMPAIAADEKRLKQLYPLIKRYCDNCDINYRIIRLHERTDITDEFIKSAENEEARKN